jgi:hypothetical protein
MKIKTTRERPEAKIQRDLIAYLRDRDWMVKPTHGNAFQVGFPDLYCFHRKYRERWIDCKNAGRYTFTIAQRQTWPAWDEIGIGIWILTGANQAEYDKLFAPPNWRAYWKKSWRIPTAAEIDHLLREIALDH